MDRIAVLAARNNADWCDSVCRSFGLPTAFHPDVWISRRRTPPTYPDAVTLTDRVPVDHLLSQIDRSAGCSIKDSFASLDLSGAGFHVLFAAEWLHLPAASHRAEHGLRWSEVGTPDELHAWATAHGGREDFRPALLDDPATALFTAHDGDGDVAGGVAANRSESVVGLSNLFSVTDIDRVWAGAIAAISARFPGLPLVGYEDGSDLDAARRAGFRTVGPLRVWLKD